MTIHMQEADAARDFSKVMEHVRAGDRIVLECDGTATATIEQAHLQRGGANSSYKDALALLERMEEERGPVMPDDGWEQDMQKAREMFNQPLEDRTSWA